MTETEPTHPIVNIVGEHVALGPMMHEHQTLQHRWWNDMRTLRTTGIGFHPRTLERMNGWLSSAGSQEDSVWFMIYERVGEDGFRPIGFLGLRDIDEMNGTAEYGITIGDPSVRGKGYGTEATRLILDYAFTARGLRNVLLDVVEFSLAGIRAYEKAGFREIGRRRQCELVGQRLWDMIYMEAVADGFESPVLSRVFVPDEPRAS